MTTSISEHTSDNFRLDFNEANIITETSHRANDRASFMVCLTNLEENTSDPFLVSCVKGLISKISSLDEESFHDLLQDAKTGSVLFPSDYQLPKTSEISL